MLLNTYLEAISSTWVKLYDIDPTYLVLKFKIVDNYNKKHVVHQTYVETMCWNMLRYQSTV